MNRISLILIVFLTVCFIQNACVQKPFQLGFVKDYDFSGDSIWLANTKEKDQVNRKEIAVFGNSRLGKININGRDLEEDDLPDENFKVGKGGNQIWKGENITVRLDYVFTWLCPPKDEQCEVYYYKGILDIDYNGERRKVDIVGFGGS